MSFFLAQLLNGLSLGSIYALISLGFALLLIVGGVLQYAYSHLVVLSMYVLWFTLTITNNNYFLSFLLAIISGLILGVLTEPIFRILTNREAIFSTFIVSIALALLITDIISRKIHGGFSVSFEDMPGKEILISSGIIAMNTGQIITLAGSIISVGIFFYFLYKTKLGRVQRAIAQSPKDAKLLGIPILKTRLLSYLIAGFFGGISAIFLSLSMGYAGPVLGNNLAIKVLAISLVAGLGNLKGGLIIALLLGILEAMAIGYVPGDWSDGIAYGVIIIIVLIKPEGLFTRK